MSNAAFGVDSQPATPAIAYKTTPSVARKVGQVKTAVAVAHPCEHRAMIEPDNSGVAKRRQECDVAGPLRGQLLQQLARRIFRPDDFRHQKRHRNREHVVAERLQPIGFCQPHVRPWRILLGLGGRRVSCLVVLIGSTGRANPLDCHDGRQFRPGEPSRTGWSPGSCAVT
jgi:hypothetical protein